MITPQEIKEKEFTKAVFGGYDMTAVDTFLEKLREDYAELYRENSILKGKIKVLVEKVEEYRSSEEAMRMAILSAQKMGDDIIERANAKSAEIIAKAEEESTGKLMNIDEKIDRENERLVAAQYATREFVLAQRQLLALQAERLDELEAFIGLEDRLEEEAEDAELEAEELPELAETVESAEAGETEDEAETPAEETAVSEEDAALAEAEKREDEIIDTAREIDSAVSKLVDGEIFVPTEPAGDVFRRKTADSDWSDDDEPTSTRPKFNFDNLQFGDNYTSK